MIFIVQIEKREYVVLQKSGRLIRTPTGFEEVTICSKRKKGNGKTYYVTDKLKLLAEKLLKENNKNQ